MRFRTSATSSGAGDPRVRTRNKSPPGKCTTCTETPPGKSGCPIRGLARESRSSWSSHLSGIGAVRAPGTSAPTSRAWSRTRCQAPFSKPRQQRKGGNVPNPMPPWRRSGQALSEGTPARSAASMARTARSGEAGGIQGSTFNIPSSIAYARPMCTTRQCGRPGPPPRGRP